MDQDNFLHMKSLTSVVSCQIYTRTSRKVLISVSCNFAMCVGNVRAWKYP